MTATRTRTCCSLVHRGDDRSAGAGALRVLLLSPESGRDFESGDTAYTAVLKQHPPPGVVYTGYGDALEDGSLQLRGRRLKHGRTSAVDVLLLGARVVERAVRDRALFREPWWFVTANPERYDLIHSHLFGIRQIESRVPVFSSAGFPLSELYRHRDHWTPSRVDRADRAERLLARGARAHMPGYYAPQNDVMSVYTEHYREWLVRWGQPPASIHVVGQGLPDLPHNDIPHPATVGFIGRDFVRKGGPVALAAFQRLRERRPDLRMILVTTPTTGLDDLAGMAGVALVTDADRTTVVHALLPQIDVLLAPTQADCGAPYGLLEGMRAGCALVVTPNPWLDGRLMSAKAVTLAMGVDEVVDAAERRLLDLEDPECRQSVRDEWRELFGLEAFHSSLRIAYRQAQLKAGRA